LIDSRGFDVAYPGAVEASLKQSLDFIVAGLRSGELGCRVNDEMKSGVFQDKSYTLPSTSVSRRFVLLEREELAFECWKLAFTVNKL